MIVAIGITTIFILFCLAVIYAPLAYKKYGLLLASITPFGLAVYFFENTKLYVILSIIYLIVFYILTKKDNILFYITDWKINIPIGLSAGSIVAGAFYYIVSNNKSILTNNMVAYDKLVKQIGILDLLYISIIILLIYIIGSWGILRRRPKYLNLLTKNNQYNDESENKDG